MTCLIAYLAYFYFPNYSKSSSWHDCFLMVSFYDFFQVQGTNEGGLIQMVMLLIMLSLNKSCSTIIMLCHIYKYVWNTFYLRDFLQNWLDMFNFFRFEVLYHFIGLNQELNTDLQQGWMQLQKKIK